MIPKEWNMLPWDLSTAYMRISGNVLVQADLLKQLIAASPIQL